MKLLEVKDLAEKLQCKISAAYELMNADDFPSFKIGRTWKAPESEVDQWILRKAREKLR